ncbi:2OG-Fe dioxygenase family protein [Rubrivivax gelatinosus]|uniref:2OG-Fe dioxygenase family protein n=1 Tax=Rubrivivax gelatinosus TaxID=28068 RepID=A0ABS1DWD1_RUBGE|nr:hypothetical protein [Rubrivivax gelatinosus]
MNPSPSPPLTPLSSLHTALMGAGWAVLDTHSLTELVHQPLVALQALEPAWDQLPPDQHLRDGGRYRRRRHGCFVVDGGRVEAAPPRAHWQPVEYNALHGGIERWFEPLPADWAAQPAWPALLAALAGVAARLRGDGRWYVEAHPFRIDTTDGIGRPTPEGAHRDGVDLVAVILVARHQVQGGETRVFEAAGAHGVRFTLAQPWSVLLLDDERVIHESTPIRPAVAGQPAWRDTLVLTFRRHGFQGPGAG